MALSSRPHIPPHDSRKADEIWAHLQEFAGAHILPPTARALSDTLFGNSPYLARLAQQMPEFACEVLRGQRPALMQAILRDMESIRPKEESRAQLAGYLRRKKAETALVLAAEDVGGTASLEDITHGLSAFADAAVQLGLAHLVAERRAKGEIGTPDGTPDMVDPTYDDPSGYFILALGKHGGRELNYSSDIDLVALYDPARVRYDGRKTAGDAMIRLTQDLIALLDQRTADGYVFRVDLRLRPDPGATPVAISTHAAESYYQSAALNWERSAMIKARFIAGDRQAAAEYLDHLGSWIWRRTIDFAALADISALKDQVHSHFGQTDKTFAGYDVKLGPGGIREIEFFAQINQLLHGGRRPALRSRETLVTLQTLVTEGLLPETTARDLTAAYYFLRMLEHRLQMIADEQTHRLPEDRNGLDHVAGFAGFTDAGALERALGHHTRIVRSHFDDLMPDSANSGAEPAFSPDALEATLRDLGFEDPAGSAERIAIWRRGRYRALKTQRARELLDCCLAPLTEALSMTAAPSAALVRFESWLGQLPSGVQIFSLFQANPNLFRLVARIMGLAPALAETLAKQPGLWDTVLDPEFFAPIEDETVLETRLSTMFERAADYQDMLDAVRHFVGEHRFRIGVHMLEGLADVRECGTALARVADVALKLLIPRVEDSFAEKFGRIRGGGLAVLAMGKYGGRELTHTSDLDLVFLYHVPLADPSSAAIQSDGPKPLGPSQYYSRLVQQVVTAITALTPAGRLFEVDTRLRPSGAQGPLVVTLKTFADYYRSAAWMWEHMALTRARLILAPDSMAGPLNNTILSVLTCQHDGPALLLAVADMRAKLAENTRASQDWAVKHGRGGLVDIEFICQYLMLRDGENTRALFTPSISDCLKGLAQHGILARDTAEALDKAYWLQSNIQAILRLSFGETIPGTDSDLPPGLREILCHATGLKTFDDLKQALSRSQGIVYSIFQQLITVPAGDLQTPHSDGQPTNGENT